MPLPSECRRRAFGLGMRAGGWKCEVDVGISHHADVFKHHQPYLAVAGGLLRACVSSRAHRNSHGVAKVVAVLACRSRPHPLLGHSTHPCWLLCCALTLSVLFQSQVTADRKEWAITLCVRVYVKRLTSTITTTALHTCTPHSSRQPIDQGTSGKAKKRNAP